MRGCGSAHARVAGAAFYTHVATVARQPGEAGAEDRPEEEAGESCQGDGAIDWERWLFPVTLRPTRRRRSSEYFHPRDPRRQRQLQRERDEFARNWTKNGDENRWRDGGRRSGRGEGIGGGEEGELPGGSGLEGEAVVLITIGENGDELMDGTEATGNRSREEGRGRRTGEELKRSSSGAKIEGRSKCSKTERNRTVWLDEGSPEALSTSTAVAESDLFVAKRPKLTEDDSGICDTPELLDERVGNSSPFIVRIPRTAITLNLNSYNGHDGAASKDDGTRSRPSTEIRLADSSIPDLAPNGNEEGVVRVEKSTVTNKPRIVEDLTCLEGTLVPRPTLKRFAEEAASATRKRRRPEVDGSSARNAGDDDPPRRSRVREKFRRLFGNDVTLSESDEEKRITAKLTSRKRRHESRMSSDSGVCLNDHASEVVYSEARDNENPGEYPGGKLRKNSKDHLGEDTKENRREYPGESTKEGLGEYTEANLGECPRGNVRQDPREKPRDYTGKNPRANSEERTGKSPRECPRENSTGNPRECPRENSTRSPREYLRENSGGAPRECPREISTGNPREYPRENSSGGPRECPRENSTGNPRECPRENSTRSPREYLRENSSGAPRECPREISTGNPREYPRENSSGAPRECPREKSTGNPREYPRENSTRSPREYLRENSSGAPRECPSDRPRERSAGKPREFPRAGDPREVSSMAKEATEVESARVLSMPLLDPVGEERGAEAREEALPDSSTSLPEKVPTQPDSSSSGKLTIVVTPMNDQDSDAFDPLKLEFDVSEEAQISTPTSTTSGPPVVESMKLEGSSEDREGLVGTRADDAPQVADRMSVKEDFSPEAETKSCDEDRLIIAKDLGPEAGQSQGGRGASEDSGPRILDPPILPQRLPDSMSGAEEKSSTGSDVDSSSGSNATAEGSSPIEKGAHQVLLIPARIVDFDPASGMLIVPVQVVKVSNETPPETVDPNTESSSDQPKLGSYVSLTRPSNENVGSSNSAKLDDSPTGGLKFVNLGLEFDRKDLTPQGLEDPTKVPGNPDHEVPDSEIPECVFDAQKMKDPPKAPNFRVLHPSELGSRWCPTPLVTETPQNQPRSAPNPAMTQPRSAPNPAMTQPRLSPNPAIAQPPLYPPLPRSPNSQILRNPSYPQILQPPPEVFIQTPPASPLEQMQYLISQKSSSGHGVEDLTSKSPTGHVPVPLGPRPVPTGSGLKHQSWSAPTASPSAVPLGLQHSLMSRIFDCLIPMSSLIERVRRESDMATILQLDKDYVARRQWLFVELGRYACTQGTKDLRTLVAKIMNYYDYLVPPKHRTLNVEAVVYIVGLERATMASALCAGPAELRPPPPYRPNRPSVTQSSPFTEQQLQRFWDQVTIYHRLCDVLNYQLVAQRRAEGAATKTRRTRRRHPRAPAGQKQVVQAAAAGGHERPGDSTGRELRMVAPATVDQPRSLQQTMECTIEPMVRNEEVANCTVTDKRHAEIVELALRDANVDKTVTDIINDLFRQHPTERMSEGRAGQINSQGQNMVGNIQGQSIDITGQGQRIDINVQGQGTEVSPQGQRIDINVQGQSNQSSQGQIIERHLQGQAIDINIQSQYAEKSVQGQTIETPIQGQTIETPIQGQTIETPIQGQTIETPIQGQIIETSHQGQDIDTSHQGQTILDVDSQTNEANVPGPTIKQSVQFDPVEVNARAEAIEDEFQGQAVVEEDSPVECALNRSASSVEDGNTSVLDVLKELEVLDSITKGPRRSKRSETTKTPEGNKPPDAIAKERGSKAADPTCPEDPPKSTASADDAKTDDHRESALATSADVGAGSSGTVPVITIEDDEDWDPGSTNSGETVRNHEDPTIVDEISILDVKTITKDVFNNMGLKADEEETSTVAGTDEEPANDDDASEECVDIKAELSDCFQCGRRSEVVCEQCRLAAYCSPECHEHHWSAIHHLTCKPAPQD